MEKSPTKNRMTIDSGHLSGESLDRLKDWVTFYRNNIHRFIEHYFGLELHFYQKIWIYLISKSTRFLGIAARASAKSWLIGVYVIAKCILYPETKVSLNSSTKAQAGLIISDKIQSLYDSLPNVQREIKNITTNSNKWQVDFYNGSIIKVIISGEGGRGARSTVNVLEERRLIPSAVIDSIIRPFLVSRTAPYMNLPEYRKLKQEEPQEIIITSSHFKSGEWYKEALILLQRMINGDTDIKAIFLDYLIALRHGIKTKKQMVQEKATMSDPVFKMEYENLAFSGSNNGMFKSSMFTRTLKRPWIPPNIHTITKNGKNPYDIPRLDGEVRLLHVDVALVGGKANDNSIFICSRNHPTKKGYREEICHIESFNGTNALSQALRIKQIWHDFCGYENPEDTLILDVKTMGRGIYDPLTQMTSDDERDLEYPAMTVQDEPLYVSDGTVQDLKDRTLSKDAVPCIYPIVATAELNSIFAQTMRDRMKKGLLAFIVEEPILEEHFIRKKDTSIMESSMHRALLLGSSIQTTMLVNEMVSLELVLTGTSTIKLKEAATARKDRYTALSYGNYYVSLLDNELLKDDNDTDSLTEWMNGFGMT